MPTRNINLTPHFDRFIEEEVSAGRYGSASEVVREGLRLVEARKRQEQAKLEKLRAMVQVGIEQLERGERVTHGSAAERREAIEQIAREASQEIARRRRAPRRAEASAR